MSDYKQNIGVFQADTPGTDYKVNIGVDQMDAITTTAYSEVNLALSGSGSVSATYIGSFQSLLLASTGTGTVTATDIGNFQSLSLNISGAGTITESETCTFHSLLLGVTGTGSVTCTDTSGTTAYTETSLAISATASVTLTTQLAVWAKILTDRDTAGFKNGFTGTFPDNDGATITVIGGIIISKT